MGMDPASWAALAAAAIAAAGGVATTVISQQAQPKKPSGAPIKNDVPGPDEARQRLEAEEALRKRRGLAANILQGDNAAVATTQSGSKTTLG